MLVVVSAGAVGGGGDDGFVFAPPLVRGSTRMLVEVCAVAGGVVAVGMVFDVVISSITKVEPSAVFRSLSLCPLSRLTCFRPFANVPSSSENRIDLSVIASR